MLDPVSVNAFWPDRSDEAFESFERPGCCCAKNIGELARAIRGGSHVGEARKQRRDSASDRLLRDAAIKAQRRSDLCDHVGGQELHHNRDETCGHGDLSILILVVR